MSETYKWLVAMAMLFSPKDTASIRHVNDSVTVDQLKSEAAEMKRLKNEVIELNRIVDSAQSKRK